MIRRIETWKQTTIGEVADLATGTTPPSKQLEYFDGDIDWYTPSDIQNQGFLVEASKKVSELAVEKRKARVFNANTILVTCIGDIGRLGILSKRSSANQQITGISLKTNNFTPEYLFYYLLAAKKELIKRSSQSVVPILNQEKLKQVPIKYPSLTEQQQIIDHIKECLSRVNEIRVLQGGALKEANSLLMSFIEAQIESDWVWQSISEITTDIRNGWSWKESSTGQPKQVLRLSSIRNLSIDIHEVRTVCLENKQSEEFSLKRDDVFLVRGNGSKHLVGRSALSTDNHSSVVFNDLLIRLRFTPKMSPEFANFMLHSRKVREQIEQVAKTAAGIWKINQTGIRALKLPCPSIEVQQEKLVALREGLAASKQIVQHFSQTDTKALSDAILRKAFVGEL